MAATGSGSFDLVSGMSVVWDLLRFYINEQAMQPAFSMLKLHKNAYLALCIVGRRAIWGDKSGHHLMSVKNVTGPCQLTFFSHSLSPIDCAYNI